MAAAAAAAAVVAAAATVASLRQFLGRLWSWNSLPSSTAVVTSSVVCSVPSPEAVLRLFQLMVSDPDWWERFEHSAISWV